MNKERQIQIPEELWSKIVLYFASDPLIRDEYEYAIRQGINSKIEAQIKRQLYSKYKTAPSEEQREQAREEYLDRAGIRKDFRY